MIDKDIIKKRSRQAAIISSIGFLIIILAFGFASWQLQKLNAAVAAKNKEIKALDALIENRNKDIKAKKVLIDTLISEINKLKDPRIQPKVRAVAIPGVFDSQKRQVYDFTVWVTSSQHTLNKISKVSYQFGHDTFILRNRESNDNSNGFLVSYRGWGCLSIVKIIVEYREGNNEVLYFDMCNALNW